MDAKLATAALSDAELRGALEGVLRGGGHGPIVGVVSDDGHTNEIFRIELADGRALLLKRGRDPWAAGRFEAAARAAELLRTRTALVVPRPLVVPDGPGRKPIQAYWWIPRPTLAAAWPALAPEGRKRAMRSLGRLLARLHRLELPRWGPLGGGSDGSDDPLGVRDLAERLAPAARTIWPEVSDALVRLAAWGRTLEPRADGLHPTFAHRDVHLGNVLCRTRAGLARCVGVLDLDEACAAPPESDLARFDVLHGPLFAQHVSPRWRAELWKGYGRIPDRALLAYFRALHLANLGFQSALLGHDVHAGMVARALYDGIRQRAPRARHAPSAGAARWPPTSAARGRCSTWTSTTRS